MNVNSSTTTLTFTAPSLPDGVFTDTVVVMVTAISNYGIGPASDPVTAIITGTYVAIIYYGMFIVCNYFHYQLLNKD